MKTFLFCLGVGALFAVSAISSSCKAAELPRAEVAYCQQWADAQYGFALDAGSGLPDAAYEGAEEQCEVQWMALAAQWDAPADVEQLAVLGLASGAAEGMTRDQAMARAKAEGACGVTRVAPELYVVETDCGQ